MKTLLATILLLLSGSLFAADATLNWTAPTTRTDGSALEATDIAGYNVYKGTSPDTLNLYTNVRDTTYTDADIGFGSKFYGVTVVDTDGNESAMSNVVSKTVVAPPSTVTITIQ